MRFVGLSTLNLNFVCAWGDETIFELKMLNLDLRGASISQNLQYSSSPPFHLSTFVFCTFSADGPSSSSSFSVEMFILRE